MMPEERKEATEANREKDGWFQEGWRTFIFQKEQTQQSLMIDLTINPKSTLIDLNPLFTKYCPLSDHVVSIYHPDLHKFIPLSSIGSNITGLLPKIFVEPQMIMIRFRQRQNKEDRSESDSGVESGKDSEKGEGEIEKKDRCRERTIGEAIQLVKRWRMVHADHVKHGHKKYSLSEAAKVVGISKKTLDDYYYQLRLGEYYSFDFGNYLNEKIGILRAFVKEFKPDRQPKNKKIRHPRHLKVIEEFQSNISGQGGQTATSPSPISEEEPISPPCSLESLPLEPNIHQEEPSLNPSIKEMPSFQDKFFKNFEFLLDDPNDPFVQLEISCDFRKKQFQDSKDDLFFF